jgi:hypothetical protein
MVSSIFAIVVLSSSVLLLTCCHGQPPGEHNFPGVHNPFADPYFEPDRVTDAPPPLTTPDRPLWVPQLNVVPTIATPTEPVVVGSFRPGFGAPEEQPPIEASVIVCDVICTLAFLLILFCKN